MTNVDKIFRKIAEERFGKEQMDLVSNHDLELTRCEAFQIADTIIMFAVASGTEPKKGITEEIFCRLMKKVLEANNSDIICLIDKAVCFYDYADLI